MLIATLLSKYHKYSGSNPPENDHTRHQKPFETSFGVLNDLQSKAAVVISCYNYESFVERAIQSVLSQAATIRTRRRR